MALCACNGIVCLAHILPTILVAGPWIAPCSHCPVAHSLPIPCRGQSTCPGGIRHFPFVLDRVQRCVTPVPPSPACLLNGPYLTCLSVGCSFSLLLLSAIPLCIGYALQERWRFGICALHEWRLSSLAIVTECTHVAWISAPV